MMALTNPMSGGPKAYFLSQAKRKQSLSLVSVNGPRHTPVLTIQVLETGERVTVTMDKLEPRKWKVMQADLTHPPKINTGTNPEVSALTLKFYNNNYRIAVIDQNEVVISA